MKDKYKVLCAEDTISIFHQPWWLDAVCRHVVWNVILAFDKSNHVVGSLPYLEEKKYGLLISRTPALTPFLGPWIRPSNKLKRHAQYSHEAKIMEELVKQLPSVFYFFQKLPPSITNWYPFYLHGYDQSTSYTYILKDIRNLELVWGGMKNTVRTAIRKSEQIVEIIGGDSVDILFEIQKEIFSRQKSTMPYSNSLLENLYEACSKRNRGKVFYAVDQKGEIYGGLFMVWDKHSAYNLIMGAKDQYRSSGVIQHLMWHSIKYASKMVDTYNFEGTMLPHVEPVFRHFGGERTPYFRISKDKNRLTKALRILLGKQ